MSTSGTGSVSRGTVRKIRDMLKAGKLNFILDLEEAPSLVTSAIDVAQELTAEEKVALSGIPKVAAAGSASILGVNKHSEG